MKIKQLRQICQSSKEAPSLASQTFWGRLNRVFSIYLTYVFIRLPFSPNQITIFGTCVFLAGCLLFARGEFKFSLIGWSLIVLSYMFDAVDGELARYRNVMKKYDIGGVYVEPVSHDVQYGFMLLPIGYGACAETGSILLIVAAALATIAKLLFRLLEFRHLAAIRHIDEINGKTYGWKVSKTTPKTFSYFIYRNVSTVTGMIPLLLIAIISEHVDYFVYFYFFVWFGLWIYLFQKHVSRIKMLISDDFINASNEDNKFKEL